MFLSGGGVQQVITANYRINAGFGVIDNDG